MVTGTRPETDIKPSTILVSSIKLRFVENGTDGLLAWASCIISDAIKLDNIAIRRSRDGSIFLTYPSKRTANGDKHNYFNPVSTEAAMAVQDAVLARLETLAQTSANSAGRGDGAT